MFPVGCLSSGFRDIIGDGDDSSPPNSRMQLVGQLKCKYELVYESLDFPEALLCFLAFASF
jgi:hypothetical protein